MFCVTLNFTFDQVQRCNVVRECMKQSPRKQEWGLSAHEPDLLHQWWGVSTTFWLPGTNIQPGKEEIGPILGLSHKIKLYLTFLSLIIRNLSNIKKYIYIYIILLHLLWGTNCKLKHAKINCILRSKHYIQTLLPYLHLHLQTFTSIIC